MLIDLAEFRNRAMPAFEFADRAFSKLEQVQSSPGFHRRAGDVKQLVEEIIPIAYLLKHLEGPQSHLRCRYMGADSDSADARLTFRGKSVEYKRWPRWLLLEVTTACHKRAYLQHELLESQGSVFLGPGIHRTKSRHQEGSTIISAPVVQQGGREAEDAAHLVRTAIAKKASRVGRRRRMLLVSLEVEGFLMPQQFREALDMAYDRETARKFHFVYVFERTTGQVARIE